MLNGGWFGGIEGFIGLKFGWGGLRNFWGGIENFWNVVFGGSFGRWIVIMGWVFIVMFCENCILVLIIVVGWRIYKIEN